MEINNVYNTDCLGTDGMCKIKEKSVDMILADLPYGKKTGFKWDTVLPYDKLWEQYLRIIKDDGAIVLFAQQPFTSALIMSQIELFRYRWIWDKIQGGNFQLAKLQPMNTVEDICVFSKAKTANGAKQNMVYYPIKTPRDKPTQSGGKPSTTNLLNENNMKALRNTYTDKYPTSILTYSKPTNNERIHSTQKSVELCEYLIRTYTKENQTVCDNVMGSFTTAIACLKTNRNFIGFEIDKEMFEKGYERVNNYLEITK